jgi:5-methyltetrahydrofolate--homocysteine methyltransferase
VPIVVGGATTSAVHTAVKLAPQYDGCVVYGGDASQTSLLAKHLQMNATMTIEQIKAEQQTLRKAYEEHHAPLLSYAEANAKAPHFAHQSADINTQFSDIKLQISDIVHLIDWRMFLLFWGFKGETLQQLLVNPEAERTLQEGKRYLQQAIEQDTIEVMAVIRNVAAKRCKNDILLDGGTILPMLRSQSSTGHYMCLSDFFDEHEPSQLGLFTIVARPKQQPTDEVERLMSHAICSRLAEACAEHIATNSLRVAFGYATCPDHSLKRIVFDLLDAEKKLNITLTDHYSIQPSTTICGLLINHTEARYFSVGRIDEVQLADYCQRRGINIAEGEQLLSKFIQRK